MPKQPLGRIFVAAFLASYIAIATAKPAAPQRVISLAPHLTEAVFWLGGGDKLIGRDRYSNHPEAASGVNIVGDAYSLNIEALLANKPDLVLLWQAPKALQQQLQDYGLPLFTTNPQTLLAVEQELERLAKALGLWPNQAFAELKQQIKQLQSERLKHPIVELPRKALLLVQSQPPIALGNGDPLAASLNFCGWENALLQAAAVVNLNPEFLPGGDYDAVISFTQQDNAFLKPVANIRPVADPLLRPGPRFPQALLALCQQLNN